MKARHDVIAFMSEPAPTSEISIDPLPEAARLAAEKKRAAPAEKLQKPLVGSYQRTHPRYASANAKDVTSDAHENNRQHVLTEQALSEDKGILRRWQ